VAVVMPCLLLDEIFRKLSVCPISYYQEAKGVCQVIFVRCVMGNWGNWGRAKHVNKNRMQNFSSKVPEEIWPEIKMGN